MKRRGFIAFTTVLALSAIFASAMLVSRLSIFLAQDALMRAKKVFEAKVTAESCLEYVLLRQTQRETYLNGPDRDIDAPPLLCRLENIETIGTEKRFIIVIRENGVTVRLFARIEASDPYRLLIISLSFL